MTLLSTIVLNRNQADLLRRTLASYTATVGVSHEIVIIDNGSTDDSPDVIRAFCDGYPASVPILLSENQGSAAINLGLDRAAGRYVHLSENDIEYLPDWSRTVVDLFESFPTLGQLSPFGPAPEDWEARTSTPCALRHSAGRILYEMAASAGATSVLRRELVERGIRMHNRARADDGRLLDDARLSRDVIDAGYFVACAAHSLVHRIGRPAGQHEPHPKRSSFLLPRERISAEKSAASPECSEPWLWSMFDGWTAEVETIEFLYALVRLHKPRFIVETGTWHGVAARAMGQALQDNGRGRLVSLELDAESHDAASARIREAGLESRVELVLGSSLEFTPPEPIDLALFDSDLSLRGAEFGRYEPFFSADALVLFHDTSSVHNVVRTAVASLLEQGILDGFFLSTPRGLAVCRYRGRTAMDRR